MNPNMISMADLLGLPLNQIEEILPEQIPGVAGQLLVHERDMTGRLAAYYQSPIALRTLSIHREEKLLYRRVLLETACGRTVEFGAIRIYLDRFSGDALQAVQDCCMPLGSILTGSQIPFRCDLQGFFRLQSDAELANLFGLEEAGVLFGRANRLETTAGLPIADVIEILPPTVA